MRSFPGFFLAIGLLATLAATSPGCSCGGEDSSTGATGSTASGMGGAGGEGGSLTIAASSSGTGGGTGGTGGAGGGESCIFVPPAGAFTPQLDCAWSGPPAGGPYAARDDVVM